jgi:hypothetical protein
MSILTISDRTRNHLGAVIVRGLEFVEEEQYLSESSKRGR